MKYYHDAERDVLIRRDENGLFVVIPSLPELDGGKEEVVTASTIMKTTKAVKGEKCSQCHTTGTRHFKNCPTTKNFVATVTADLRKPLNEIQYIALRDALHDKEFTSLHYSRDNNLPRWEVNQAIKSVDYRDYIKSRE